MSTKKNTKISAFNRKNVQQLADTIYSDEGGRVSFLKLCDGNLRNGKDGGRTLHCAVGELYHQFVEPGVSTPMKTANKLDEKNEAVPHKYDFGISGDDKATIIAINQLVDVAHLKSDTLKNKDKLAQALADCVDVNDSATADRDHVDEYVMRSHDVARVLRKRVLPLLK